MVIEPDQSRAWNNPVDHRQEIVLALCGCDWFHSGDGAGNPAGAQPTLAGVCRRPGCRHPGGDPGSLPAAPGAVFGRFPGGRLWGFPADRLLGIAAASTWMAFIIGGIVGLLLVSSAFDWSLYILSSWAGATLVTQAIDLQGTVGTVVFFALFVLG